MLVLKRLGRSLIKLMMVSLCMFVVYVSQATAAANVATIESAVTAFKTIGTLRREFPINGDAVAVAYTGALQTLTQEIDTANSLTLDSDVLAAIDDLIQDREPRLAAQTIDKTLQRVFYQSIWNRISAIRDQFSTATAAALVAMLDESVAAFQAISATVARENQVLTADRQELTAGSNPGLDAEVNDFFSKVRTALNKSNPEEDFNTVQVARYGVRMSLARAYYIGVLREVGEVLENRTVDPDEARIEQKEGEIFYRIIEPLVARGNPVGSLIIKSQLTGNLSKVVADEIVSELGKGFIPRVIGELNGQASAITSNDRAQALAEAAGAKYFARILLPDLELRIGVTERNNLEQELENLLTASDELNATESEQARDAITAILTKYENQLNRATYEIAQHTAIIDNAVANFLTVGDLRSKSPIDVDAIAANYAGDLQQLTKIVDQIYGTTIDQDVSNAINQARSGSQLAQALQIIDKSLQRVFALVVYNRVTLVAEQFTDLSADALALEWDRAYSAYTAIAGTANRPEKMLAADKKSITTGTDPDLDYQIVSAFARGKQAFTKENADDRLALALARENIVIPLVRSFLIGVLREVEGIITNRDADIDKAKEQQVEGEYFFRTVDAFISPDNPSGSGRIHAQFTGDVTNVVADTIVSDISKGILGQIKRSMSQVEANFLSDKDQALLAVERLSLYTGIFAADLQLRLNVLQRAKLENAIRDLREAVRTEDTDRAVALRSILMQVITEYESKLS
ncbi:hypothetical protein [Nitrosomonas sp.]|uniref:hypothetical protein n=1 Tax=Nitrosomonas sp. TaxID=42353 RepID=UPI0025DAD8D0|nr:hypothetical protein [Nitrosomonas sp.]